MKKHAQKPDSPASLDVPNPAHLNMAAKPEQQRRADAKEVMLATEQGGEAEREYSREIQTSLRWARKPPPRGRGPGREREAGESGRRSRPAVACVSEAPTPGGYAAELA